MKDLVDKHKSNPYIYLVLFVLILTIHNLFYNKPQKVIPYSEFLSKIEAGQVEEVLIEGNSISGKYVGSETIDEKDKGQLFFITYGVEAPLAKLLKEKGVKFSHSKDASEIEQFIGWIFPTLIFIGFWLFLLRRMGKGGMGGGLISIGKSKAKVYLEKEIKITFKDVAGVDEAKRELQEIVDFLKNAEYYGRLGGRMPKGILLVGPPGTGKTLIAKAVAGEASVPFFSISGSEFVEMFVGVGAARVRDLFAEARKTAPCIIFIDELDALGKARGGQNGFGGHDEKEQTLNQLLTELDGFDSKEGVILLGATNRPEILDPALLRAGRFDRQVLVDRPDKLGRIEILKVHVKPIKIAPNLELESIASLTTGFTGADLANLCNEAALIATRRKADIVEQQDFGEAIERIIAGLEKKNRILSVFERKVTAYHEMGHAIVAKLLQTSDMVHKVSIIPRGFGALGYTIQRPIEDRFLMTKPELQNKLCVLLAGRAAEKVVFDHLSTGASDDLSKATDIARGMAVKYGMVSSLGNVTYEKESQRFLPGSFVPSRDYSEVTSNIIDEAVRHLVDDALRHAIVILQLNRQILDDASAKLLVQETLEAKDLDVLFAGLEAVTSNEPLISDL